MAPRITLRQLATFTAIAVYLLVRGQFPMLVNNALMLFLTIGAIPMVAREADWLDMAAAILLAAAYTGGLLWVALMVGKRRAATAARARTA